MKDPYIRLHRAEAEYKAAVAAHNEAASRRDVSSRELAKAEEACRVHEQRERKNAPDPLGPGAGEENK